MKTLLTTLFLFIVSPALALNVGDKAADFDLNAADGSSVKLSSFKDKVVVLEWTNPGCPYVKKHYRDGNMQALQKEMREKGIVWLTINSTSSEHSDFISPDKRAGFVAENHIESAAYLFDPKGEVGQIYEAKTTPHMFVIDKNGIVVYKGAIDDTPMGDPAQAKNYVKHAVAELEEGKPISEPETKSYGCSVKY